MKDVEWLQEEIFLWVFHNLWKRWPGIVRRHTATKSTAVATLHAKLSGYDARQSMVQRALDKLGIKVLTCVCSLLLFFFFFLTLISYSIHPCICSCSTLTSF